MQYNCKRRFFSALLLLAVFVLSTNSFVVAAEPVLQMFAVQDSKLNVAQETLPNGLKVIVLEDHSFPTISCLMWYHVGTRNEASGLSGMSHLVEHMVFKDAGMVKSGDIPLTLARIGADFNGYTSEDFTAFYETLPATRLELALKIEAARMCNGNFTQAGINEELKRINSECETRKIDPDNALTLAVHAAAYQVHPYRIPTSGWPTDARNLTARSAQAFYDRYYVPNNASLVIVGNVVTKNALVLAQQYFGSLPRNAIMQQEDCVISEPPQNGLHSVSIKNTNSHQTLQLAYHAPAISDPDAPAMAVIESILNSHCANGLCSTLTHDHLCSNAESAFELRRDPGLFIITCNGVNGARQRSIDAIDEVIASLCHQPLSDQDLKRAKNSAEFSFMSKRNSPYRVGFDLGYFDTVGDWRSAFSWTRQLQSVSGNDVQRVARKFLDPDTRIVGWVGMPDSKMGATPKPSIVSAPKSNCAGKTAATQNKKAATGGCKKQVHPIGPKSDQQKSRQALIERVPVLCFQQNASPAPPALDQSASAAKDPAKTLAGSASKTEYANQEASAAKYVPAIANKLPAIQSKNLSNGLRLVVFESHISPIVQIMGSIEAGQAFDPSNKKGLSELAAASFNAGSISYTKNQLVHTQEDLGIAPDSMWRFESGLQSINFHSLCLSRDLKTQLELLGGVLSPNVSSDMDIDRFKVAALTTLRQNEDSTTVRVNRALLQNLLSTKSPYYPVPATEKAKTISMLQAADLKDFHDKYIVPGATVIVVAGDTTLDESARILEKTLSNWTAKSTVCKAPPVELSIQHILRTSIPLREGNHSVVCLGQLMKFGIASPDYVNLLAAGCALTEHPVLSRLGLDLTQEEPVVANGLNRGDISSSTAMLGDYVTWSLNLAVQPDVVSRTVRALLREARGLSKGGLNAVEVVEIKRYLAGALPVRCLADITSTSRNILDSTLQSNWPDFYQPLLTGVYSLSADSLNKFLHDSFRPDQSTVVVAAKPDTIRTLRKQALSTITTTKDIHY
jgi:zinc protease